jgi:hypothetical protein
MMPPVPAPALPGAGMMGAPPMGMPGPGTFQGGPEMLTPPITDTNPDAKLISRDPPEPEEARRALVERWQKRVREARTHWKPSFDRKRSNNNFVN